MPKALRTSSSRASFCSVCVRPASSVSEASTKADSTTASATRGAAPRLTSASVFPSASAFSLRRCGRVRRWLGREEGLHGVQEGRCWFCCCCCRRVVVGGCSQRGATRHTVRGSSRLKAPATHSSSVRRAAPGMAACALSSCRSAALVCSDLRALCAAVRDSSDL